MAWHSGSGNVYHNNPQCSEGNSIGARNRRSGTGGKRLCRICAGLNNRTRRVKLPL